MTFVATLINAQRRSLSQSMNPRFVLTFDTGHEYKTKTDAAVNYEVEALIGQEVEAVIDRGEVSRMAVTQEA